MKRTTSLLTTGALSLGTFAVLGTVAPGLASASGCGVTPLDLAGLEAAFAGALTGVGDGATAEMRTDGLRLTMPSAEDDPQSAAYASYFMDGLEIPLADATAQSNVDLDTTLAPGQPLTNHPTYELYVDLDGPANDDPAQAILVYWEPEAGEPTDLWWSALGPLAGLDSESSEEATLVEISAAYPDATVTSLGFQLLYQPGADVVVHGLTFGCNEFRFGSGSSTDPGGDPGDNPGGDPGGDPANQAPIAAVTATNTGATFTFSAAGSTDSDGEVTGFAWSFGDGSAPAAGAQVVHEYAAPGTYTVTLTVTDDDGASTTATRQVVVPATDPGDPTDPAEPTEYGTPLPDTGADVLGLAAIGGLVLAGGGAGLVASRRRKAGSAS
ncbi:LPXTG-motif cell wall anchor domain-containing protein [Geodermatophilus obscurus]|uniref:LPXTG-motif cell wall anchor domain-containing protein n=1 Tax=Geodermatophilus obscurus TaxID=1861 RepID=A0A1M7URU3_9ACTN|nr:PKD domain-containing protein [Geodermatophilus obscurus]SHN85732.1 LPXTG-motif cell wall anchor domain-containing protein [Geodermatophilus obscurus]